MQAFRQCCEAGVRYGYMTRNPAKLAGPNTMIESYYGTLIDTAHDAILSRLEAVAGP